MSLPVNALKAHIALNVRDVGASIDFYRKLFGIDPVKVRKGYAKFDVQNPPLDISLNEPVDSGRGALSHLGIQLASTEDVLSLRKEWTEAGLAVRDEMKTNCCFAIQDKTWVEDPDGNQWEAFFVLEDNLTESSACCGTVSAGAKSRDDRPCRSNLTILRRAAAEFIGTTASLLAVQPKCFGSHLAGGASS